MERLSGKKKHLQTILSGYTLPEDGSHLLQGLFGKVIVDIDNFGLCFTYGKTNNQVFGKAEIKTSSK